jgi:hypothetical protein
MSWTANKQWQRVMDDWLRRKGDDVRGTLRVTVTADKRRIKFFSPAERYNIAGWIGGQSDAQTWAITRVLDDNQQLPEAVSTM